MPDDMLALSCRLVARSFHQKEVVSNQTGEWDDGDVMGCLFGVLTW